jgi:CheY-like chemotaxis protein
MSEIKELRDSINSVKVLYAEDEDEVRTQTVVFLKKIFQNVDSAVNGLEALEMFKTNNYDLVITDLKMPKMNGRELLQKIHDIDKDVVLIVMTASDSNIDATTTACNAYLHKPVTLTDLLEALKPLKDKLLK